MALDVLEWGIIAVMVIGIFIWGPEKVPEIARTIGNARRDIDAYTRQFQGISRELTTSVGTGNIDSIMGTLTGLANGQVGAPAGNTAEGTVTSPPPAPPTIADDKTLIEMAKKLKISTQGKTRDQIQAEIVAKANQGEATPVTATEVTQAQAAAPEAPAPQTGQDAPPASPSAS